MAVLNQIVCADAFGNTGFGNCALIPKNITGVIIVPKSFEITAANAATLQTYLETAAQNNSSALRIFPVHGFVGATNNSEELVTQTFGYGGIAAVREGKYNWLFQYYQGGICLLQGLRKFNGTQKSVILIDADNVLYGMKRNGNFAGVPWEMFYAQPWGLNDGANVTNFGLQLVIDPKYLNDQLAYIEAKFPLTEIQGLQNVNLSLVAAATATTFNVKAVTCSGDDLFDLFSSDLADASAWSVVSKADGSAESIDSVAANAATKSWTITLDPARTDDSVVNLASVSALVGLGVEGFEGVPLDVPL